MTKPITLRPAVESDMDFIWTLRVATMKLMIEATYGWDEATQLGFARESLAGRIVLIEAHPIGVLTVADWCSELHLVWMAVVPSMQGRGIGSHLLRTAQEMARESGLPLTLQVLRNNRAIALYERFGFVPYDENGPHRILMRWEGSTCFTTQEPIPSQGTIR